MPHTKNIIIKLFLVFFLWKPAYSSCISLRIVECKSLALALSWNTHMLEEKLQSLRTCRGQMPEDEDEDNLSRPRPRTKFRPRGQSGLEDLTSLHTTQQQPRYLETSLSNQMQVYGTDIGYHHNFTHSYRICRGSIGLNSKIVDKIDSTLPSLHKNNTTRL